MLILSLKCGQEDYLICQRKSIGSVSYSNAHKSNITITKLCFVGASTDDGINDVSGGIGGTGGIKDIIDGAGGIGGGINDIIR